MYEIEGIYSYGRDVLAQRKWHKIVKRQPETNRRLKLILLEVAIVGTLFAWIGVQMCSGAGLFIPH